MITNDPMWCPQSQSQAIFPRFLLPALAVHLNLGNRPCGIHCVQMPVRPNLHSQHTEQRVPSPAEF